MTFNSQQTSDFYQEKEQPINGELNYKKSKYLNLERLLFHEVKLTNIGRYHCNSNGVLAFFLRYLVYYPFKGLLTAKYFTYKYILLGLFSIFNKLKLHDMVTEDYYIHQLNKFILNSSKNNKWFIGNIFGFNLFGIVEIFGIIILYTIDALLKFFAKGLDFRGLYKIKYQVMDTVSLDLYFLEKYSDLFRGYRFFKAKDCTYNIIQSGQFIELEYIHGLSKRTSFSKLRYSNTNHSESKSQVMLANYYLNGISLDLQEKTIRLIKINNHYKIALVFETKALKNQNNYFDKNMVLLENCRNFNNNTLFGESSGLYFKN